MSRFQRLLHVGRHRPEHGQSSIEGGTVGGGVTTLDDEPPEPEPILQPAAIFRQYLYDPSEYTPEWARPRPKPEAAPEPTPVPASDPDPAPVSATAVAETAIAEPLDAAPPKPAKRARRQPASGASTATRSRPKRSTKPKAQPGAGTDEPGGAGPA